MKKDEIETITIKKLLGRQDVIIDFKKPMQIFVGANGAGKSTIINILENEFSGNINKHMNCSFDSIIITTNNGETKKYKQNAFASVLANDLFSNNNEKEKFLAVYELYKSHLRDLFNYTEIYDFDNLLINQLTNDEFYDLVKNFYDSLSKKEKIKIVEKAYKKFLLKDKYGFSFFEDDVLSGIPHRIGVLYESIIELIVKYNEKKEIDKEINAIFDDVLRQEDSIVQTEDSLYDIDDLNIIYNSHINRTIYGSLIEYIKIYVSKNPSKGVSNLYNFNFLNISKYSLDDYFVADLNNVYDLYANSEERLLKSMINNEVIFGTKIKEIDEKKEYINIKEYLKDDYKFPLYLKDIYKKEKNSFNVIFGKQVTDCFQKNTYNPRYNIFKIINDNYFKKDKEQYILANIVSNIINSIKQNIKDHKNLTNAKRISKKKFDMMNHYIIPCSNHLKKFLVFNTDYHFLFKNFIDETINSTKEFFSNENINPNIIKLKALLEKYFFDKTVDIYPSGIYFKTKDTNKDISYNDLSYGEKKIVVLFTELLLNGTKNDIIMLDEPETALSINWQEELLVDLEKLAIENDIKIILTTHSPYMVENESLDKYIYYLEA